MTSHVNALKSNIEKHDNVITMKKSNVRDTRATALVSSTKEEKED